MLKAKIQNKAYPNQSILLIITKSGNILSTKPD